MKITLSNKTLNAIDTNDQSILQYIPHENFHYFHMPSGQEHYRLMMHLAMQYNNEIIADIGTNTGTSALALSVNPSNRICSIDIVDYRRGRPAPSNCDFWLGNVLYRSDLMYKVMQSRFISLDIDHEYHNEIQIYNRLIESDWKGIIVCDDILLNEPMKRFWNEVQSKKLDITQYGHITGTGVIILDDTEFELA